MAVFWRSVRPVEFNGRYHGSRTAAGASKRFNGLVRDNFFIATGREEIIPLLKMPE